jgi:hypothetical protein
VEPVSAPSHALGLGKPSLTHRPGGGMHNSRSAPYSMPPPPSVPAPPRRQRCGPWLPGWFAPISTRQALRSLRTWGGRRRFPRSAMSRACVRAGRLAGGKPERWPSVAPRLVRRRGRLGRVSLIHAWGIYGVSVLEYHDESRNGPFRVHSVGHDLPNSKIASRLFFFFFFKLTSNFPTRALHIHHAGLFSPLLASF